MRILFLASGEFALPTLHWLANSDHELPLIITQPARPSGRGRRTTPTPVRACAEQLGLETLETEDVNDPQVVGRIRSLDARLGLVIAFGQKLGGKLCESMAGGCINLHASLLPKYRGAAPINWAIVQGEEKTGCTVFRIVETMDAGPILTTRCTSIEPQESAGELHDRLAAIGVDAVQAALPLFEADALPHGDPQNARNVSLAPKLKKRDGFVIFDRPVRNIVNHVHGMTPWPGASAIYHSKKEAWERVTLTRVRRAERIERPTIDPGTIDEHLHVAAPDGFVEILELKPSSGRVMTWLEYVNGRHVVKGDRLAAPEKRA